MNEPRDMTEPVAAVTAAPPKNRVLDRDAALARMDGDEALFAEIAQMFCVDTPQLLSALREAAAAGNTDQVFRLAHTIKGSAGSFDAVETAGAAAAVERAARGGDLGLAIAGMDSLCSETARLIAELNGARRPQ